PMLQFCPVGQMHLLVPEPSGLAPPGDIGHHPIEEIPEASTAPAIDPLQSTPGFEELQEYVLADVIQLVGKATDGPTEAKEGPAEESVDHRGIEAGEVVPGRRLPSRGLMDQGPRGGDMR